MPAIGEATKPRKSTSGRKRAAGHVVDDDARRLADQIAGEVEGAGILKLLAGNRVGRGRDGIGHDGRNWRGGPSRVGAAAAPRRDGAGSLDGAGAAGREVERSGAPPTSIVGSACWARAVVAASVAPSAIKEICFA